MPQPGKAMVGSISGLLVLEWPGTAWIGTVVELADEMDRTVEGEEMTMAVVADVHPVTTVGAVAIEDVKLPESEVRIGLPIVTEKKTTNLVLSPGLPASSLLETRLRPVESRRPIREWLSRTQTPRNRVAATESFAAYR